MTFNRIIKDGKLQIVAQLIGGPADGMFVDYDRDIGDIVRIPKRKPLELSDLSSGQEIPMPIIEYYEYKKVSEETYKFME